MKIKTVLLLLTLCGFTAYSQVKIGDNPTIIGTSSSLELESTNKALVLTRVANTASVATPVNGMIIYDISSNCIKSYENGAWTNCWSNGGNIEPSTNGSAKVNQYFCSGAGTSSTGTITVNETIAESTVTQTIIAEVTQPGTYSLSTITNGVVFSGMGTFTSLGNQPVVLTASGTALTITTDTYTLNTTPNCSFTRTVIPHPSTNGTAIVSGYVCNTASAGSLTVGTAVSGVTQTITATVTTVGTYNITATINGVTFSSGPGTFTSTGAQTVLLTATGTPTTAGSNSFTLNTTPNCSFTRTVISPTTNGTGVVSAYNCSGTSAGTLYAGEATSGVTQQITATVTSVGTYDITIGPINGITWTSGVGTFSATGAQIITLTASGTPLATGTDTLTLNSTPNCSFTIEVIHRSTNGTSIVSGYVCDTASAGSLTVGTVVSGVTQTITATVTSVGTYNINATINGVSFSSGLGTFASTGAQSVVLTATGTPTTAGSNSFTLNTTPNCSFTRTVISPTTNGTGVVSSYNCSGASTGTLYVSVAASGVTQQITANVSSVGSYNITIGPINGITWTSGVGTFSATGAQIITLTASGTPTALGTNTLTLNTTPSCSFTRTVIPHPSTNGTGIVSGYTCNTAFTGSLIVGVPVSGVTQTITATVTAVGSYAITTPTVNGVFFSASGTFLGTGSQNIELIAYGTPSTVSNSTYTPNTSPNCSFTRQSYNATASVTGPGIGTDNAFHNVLLASPYAARTLSIYASGYLDGNISLTGDLKEYELNTGDNQVTISTGVVSSFGASSAPNIGADNQYHTVICNNNRVVTGIEIYATDYLDGHMKLRCTALNLGYSTEVGTGSVDATGPGIGADNQTQSVSCPSGQYIKGVRIYATGRLDGDIGLYCTTITP